MFILNFPEVSQVNIHLLYYFMALRVNDDHILVFGQLLPRFDILVLIFIFELNRYNGLFGLFDEGNHASTFLLGVQGG